MYNRNISNRFSYSYSCLSCKHLHKKFLLNTYIMQYYIKYIKNYQNQSIECNFYGITCNQDCLNNSLFRIMNNYIRSHILCNLSFLYILFFILLFSFKNFIKNLSIIYFFRSQSSLIHNHLYKNIDFSGKIQPNILGINYKKLLCITNT